MIQSTRKRSEHPGTNARNGQGKRCGLVIRVSTDAQAQNPEGSLKNQLQRLHAHIEYKTTACGENWVEAERYVLPAISGAKSLRSKQFAQLFQDIRDGKVDTVLCTALDRICRSVKDFLEFFEILAEHHVEFVCLKQNYDTTSAQGRLFITIMMALAEFERGQTAERNRDASLARAERGLWNGGHLLGYDLDPEQKGTLIPNPREVAIVNFAFDTYLELGSLCETVKALNDKGYRTKEYESRRGKRHPASRFYYTPVRWMLLNLAYIGKKEVNKKRRVEDQTQLPEAQRYRVVEASWPGIVPENKFYAVQRLLEANRQTLTNQVKKTRHTYVFNHGLLWCSACGKQMEGRSGTSRLRVRYYYYVCTQCRLRIPAPDIERLVLERVQVLATEPTVLTKLVEATNQRLQEELPQLQERREHLEKDLAGIKTEADGLMAQLAGMESTKGGEFLVEKLDDLAERRRQLQATLSALEQSLEEIKRQSVDEDLVRGSLGKMAEIYDTLPPYRQKGFVRLLVNRVEASAEELRISFRGKPPDAESLARIEQERGIVPRSEPLDWLLG